MAKEILFASVTRHKKKNLLMTYYIRKKIC